MHVTRTESGSSDYKRNSYDHNSSQLVAAVNDFYRPSVCWVQKSSKPSRCYWCGATRVRSCETSRGKRKQRNACTLLSAGVVHLLCSRIFVLNNFVSVLYSSVLLTLFYCFLVQVCEPERVSLHLLWFPNQWLTRRSNEHTTNSWKYLPNKSWRRKVTPRSEDHRSNHRRTPSLHFCNTCCCRTNKGQSMSWLIG